MRAGGGGGVGEEGDAAAVVGFGRLAFLKVLVGKSLVVVWDGVIGRQAAPKGKEYICLSIKANGENCCRAHNLFIQQENGDA